QAIGILAAEIIVAQPVDLIDRMRIDIGAGKTVAGTGIAGATEDRGKSRRRSGAEQILVIGNGRNRLPPARERLVAVGVIAGTGFVSKLLFKRDQVEENIIVFDRLIMHVVAADIEIKRPAEVGSESEFLIELPGAFLRKVHADHRA